MAYGSWHDNDDHTRRGATPVGGQRVVLRPAEIYLYLHIMHRSIPLIQYEVFRRRSGISATYHVSQVFPSPGPGHF
jgi:hypothetical protein